MIAIAKSSQPAGHAAPWHTSRPQPIDLFAGDLADELDADPAGDAADTLRMIELSGMIGFAPGLFEAE